MKLADLFDLKGTQSTWFHISTTCLAIPTQVDNYTYSFIKFCLTSRKT